MWNKMQLFSVTILCVLFVWRWATLSSYNLVPWFMLALHGTHTTIPILALFLWSHNLVYSSFNCLKVWCSKVLSLPLFSSFYTISLNPFGMLQFGGNEGLGYYFQKGRGMLRHDWSQLSQLCPPCLDIFLSLSFLFPQSAFSGI